MSNVVYAFENTNDYPVSLTIDGIQGRVQLPYKGAKIETKPGVYIVPAKEEWPRLIAIGVKPVYKSVPDEVRPTQPAKKVADVEKKEFNSMAGVNRRAEQLKTVNDILAELDMPLIEPEPEREKTTNELLEEADTPLKVPPLHVDTPVEPEVAPIDIHLSVTSPASDDIHLSVTSPASDPDLVTLNAAGDWVYARDNYTSPSAPGMKRHIRSAFGEDVLNKAKWQKPEA